MATTGWLGEQTVHQWGGWGTRFTTNVYISGIRRYSDHVDVSGTIYLYCKSNGAYSVWYDWNITSWSMGNNLGQIKERTYTNNILNRSWGKNFTVRINCSNSATSATFNAGFSDSNMGGRDKYWTIYFDRYATAPSGIKSTSSYTEYSTITTSCSGINWGQGYSNRTLTCTASYTFNGKTENFTLGTWTDGATSKTVTKNDFNFPADLNVSIKWIASTNVGSTTSTSQVRVGQTYPAPNLSEVNFEGSSPSTYKLNATVTGINYGENYSKREAKLYFDYTLDGISYSTLLSSISDGSTSMTVEYDATTESEPWKFIPDDEKGVLRLVVDNGHRTSTKSSAQIYCQPQYEAYIIESIPDSEKEKSEIYTGKNIQIQDAPKDAPLTDFKLKGDTFQQSYEGKNLFNKNTAKIVGGYIGVSAVVSSYQDPITNQKDRLAIVPCLPNTTYTITKPTTSDLSKNRFRIGTSEDVPVDGLKLNDYWNAGNGTTTTTHTFTTSTTANWLCIFYGQTLEYDASDILQTILNGIQLELGSTATSYEPFVGGVPSPNPDYPQPIQVVTGVQTVEIQGKNLANPTPVPGGSNGVVATYNSQTGVVTVSGTAKTTWSNPFKSIYLPAGTYTLKQYGELTNGRITCYTQGYGYQVDASTLQKTFTTTRDGYVYICITGLTEGNPASGTIKFQLEAGSTATSFVPYSKQTYTIDLGDIELCKLGDYQDYIWKDGEDWKIHKETDFATIDSLSDGSSHSLFVGSKNTTRVVINQCLNGQAANIQAAVQESVPYRFNRFIPKSVYSYDVIGAFVDVNSNLTKNGFVFRALKTEIGTTDAEVEAWLNTHPLEVHYVLATPTDTVVTDHTLIEQLEAIRKASLQSGVNNITNIAIAPNLTGDMEITYYTKWQDTFPATLYSNGKNGTGQFKQIRRIGTK